MALQPLKLSAINMSKITLSVVLATRNEQANIGRCLDAIKDIADEIIVCDESSGDRTVGIAKVYGAKIIHTQHEQNFHINKNKAIDAARSDWILQLDADEVVSPELSREILQTIKLNSGINGYWLNRRNWFLNRFLTKGGQYPDPTLRLYRNGFGRLPAKDVHEQAEVKGKTGHLKNDLLHYRDTSFEKYLEGFNRYSSFISTQLSTKVNIVSTIKYLIIKPLYIFLNIYVRHKGFVDGKAGFIFALYSGLIWSVAYIKYWQNKLS